MTELELNKNLEQLENDYWGNPNENDTHLIRTCMELRKKPLGQLTIENLRVLIGQNIGLEFLIPIALQKLEINILAEGDMYEGDLFQSVLRVKPEFWKNNEELVNKMELLFANNLEILEGDHMLQNLIIKFVENGS